MLSYTAKGKSLVVSVDKNLKDLFKTHFLGAEWSREHSAWLIDTMYEQKLQKLILSLKTEIATYNSTILSEMQRSAIEEINTDELAKFKAQAEKIIGEK